jgi:uncharacterized RDD family membrane protein YckC
MSIIPRHSDNATHGDTPAHELFSPEGVRLELAVAGPAPRMLAYGIDFAVIVVMIFFMVLALIAILPIGATVDRWMQAVFHEASRQVAERNQGHSTSMGAFGLLIALFLLAQFAVETGYFIFWEMVTNGRSPGKMLVGLRVVRRDGLPVDLKSSVLRNLLRIVDLLPENYVIGLTSMLLSPSGERLGDHVAGTIVIRLDRPQAAPEIAPSRNGVTLALTRAQLALIGPREIQLLRATLRRLPSLSGDRTNALVKEVADAMRMHLQLAEAPSSDPLTFLRDLLTVAERYSHSAD